MIGTLLSSCFINEVARNRSSKDAETKSSNDDCSEGRFSFDHGCVQCRKPAGVQAMAGGGIAPPLPLSRISRSSPGVRSTPGTA